MADKKVKKAEPLRMKKSLLEELLMQCTRPEMINSAEILALRIKKSQAKRLIASEMARIILDTPFVVLFQLPVEEIIKLKNMVYAPDHAIPYTPTYIVSPTRQIGLSDIAFIEGKYKEYLTPDLAQVLKTLFERGEGLFNDKKFHHEQLILGLLNLYGILDFKELQELSTIHKPQLKSSETEFAILSSYVLKSCSMIIAGKHYYSSPYLDDPEHILNEINSRKTLKKARFAINEVMDAGIWGAFIPPANPHTHALRKELERLHKTKEEISVFMTNIWMQTNNDLDPLPMVLEIIEKHPMKLEKVNDLMAVFMEWTNAIPRWVLKANSSKYVFETHEKPALQKRPPKLIMPQDIPGVNISQGEFNRMWQGAQPDATPKVGRNEPCPCGSGKKFKHCCIREQ